MSELNTLLQDAIHKGCTPYLVGMLGGVQGVTWTGSAGIRSPGLPASEDTVFRIASMSKAIGATAAAILADRGKLNWQTPVDEILPEFADLRVVVGFDGDLVELRPPRYRTTLHHLATHTSGLVYEFWHADIARYLPASGRKVRLGDPMAIEPGERWQYGGGVDWLGLVVEAIAGRPFDQFCKEELFDPLRMPDTRFALEGDMTARLGDVFVRSPDGGFIAFPHNVDPLLLREFHGMGNALYSTAADYMRFLRMWLNKGRLDGACILAEAVATDFLANHLGTLRLEPLRTILPPATADLDLSPGLKKTHSLGFARMEVPMPGMRSAGSQFWGGARNTQIWLDPARDVAGILMTPFLPFLDPAFMTLFAEFDRAVYGRT